MVQYWGMLLANRPDPDDPGGLGAEETGTERTGPTQGYLFAIQQGGRWAEVGQYYDSANDPVTAISGLERPPADDPPRANPDVLATALLQPPAVGAIMSLTARSRKAETGFASRSWL